MKPHPLAVAAIAALSLPAFSSIAGDWGKAPVKQSHYVEECVDVGAQISAGYSTDYIFHGVRFARDSVWTDLNYTYDRLAVPLTVGAYYVNGINGAFLGSIYDELQLYARADLGTFAGFDAHLGYTHYVFPEFRTAVAPTGGYAELNLGLRRDLRFVDLVYGAHYGFGGGGIAPKGWYHQLGVERAFGLTDSVSLVLGTGLAYSGGYWGVDNWNHYYVSASLPITLNCRATITPYIGYVGAPTGWVVDGIIGADSPQSDILHGGISLSVSF